MENVKWFELFSLWIGAGHEAVQMKPLLSYNFAWCHLFFNIIQMKYAFFVTF